MWCRRVAATHRRVNAWAPTGPLAGAVVELPSATRCRSTAPFLPTCHVSLPPPLTPLLPLLPTCSKRAMAVLSTMLLMNSRSGRQLSSRWRQQWRT